MYAQKLEGDAWREERLDKGRIDRMSGYSPLYVIRVRAVETDCYQTSNWANCTN